MGPNFTSKRVAFDTPRNRDTRVLSALLEYFVLYATELCLNFSFATLSKNQILSGLTPVYVPKAASLTYRKIIEIVTEILLNPFQVLFP